MENIKAQVKRFMDERGWNDQAPSDVAKSVVIEASELLEQFQWSNPTAAEVRDDKEKLAEVGNELADVIIYLAEMAILLGFDVEELVRAKLDKQSRKYPADEVKGKLGKSRYWEIKKAYRAKNG